MTRIAARRVVTGVAADGKAHFVSDGPAPCVQKAEQSGVEMVYVWTTDTKPRVPNAGTDQTRLDQEYFPGPEGSRFLINIFPPGFGVGSSGAYMHETSTVDYGVVLDGEITLVLDSGEEVTLRANDTVVQNGTLHGWRNTSDRPAIVAFVVLGAQDAR